MKFFLTGASGYVGAATAAELDRRGHALVILARSQAEADAAAARGWMWVIGGLEDRSLLADVAVGVDAVVHCAASDAPAFLPVNAAAIEAMIAALPDGAGFVSHAGTLVFGPTGAETFDGSEALAPPPFLAARADLDRRLLAAGSRLRVATVYAALAYGGGGAAVPNALIAAGRALGYVPFPGDGRQVWTSVHVGDWAALIATAAERAPFAGTRYVAAGRQIPIGEAAAAAAAALGLEARSAEGEPLAALGMFADPLRLDQRFHAARATALGWTATIDDLPTGMADAARSGGA